MDARTAPRRQQRLPVFSRYRPLPDAYDELFAANGRPHPAIADVVARLEALGGAELKARQRTADTLFLQGGVTFSVYSDNRGVEKIFPFDLIPRVIPGEEWRSLSRGLVQRMRALNLFLADIYGPQRILNDGVLPRDLVLASKGYLPQVHGIMPRGGVFVHVAGIDLVRDGDGRFLVLEDNLRCPSGVSYVLENRQMLKRILPGVFSPSGVYAVDAYPMQLSHALASLSPVSADDTRLVVLTPGPYNSAYFEHGFLARRMGSELVQGSDLFVHDKRVYVKTTRGPQPVHVIYRRIDDEFLDPAVFRSDSMLGVRGLFEAYAAGNVTLANALGNGVADDKAVYPFVPDMIRYYLGEEPLLGQVETFLCARDDHRRHVLANLDRMVVKAVDASGGYGMLMGPQAGQEERAEFAHRIEANPRGYIAQPRVELSTCPTLCENGIAPRRVDLRPYVITGHGGDPWVLPGGLTRVALREGSYVVNSSQGGGSKDTWVLGASNEEDT
jgi:uncharacterized circularly permuted ATP-grasp superfamily protein